MDDLPGRDWLTLSEAAAQTGYSREALRLRVRRGTLRSRKGNDGTVRVDPSELGSLPPLDGSSDVQEDDRGDVQGAAMDVLVSTVADLRTDLEVARSSLESARSDQLLDRGRAERAEAQAAAQMDRAERAEARLEAAERALEEARTPLVIRMIRALRSGKG